MNHLNKRTIPAYIIAFINLISGMYYIYNTDYLGINLISLSFALISWVFILNKKAMEIVESNEDSKRFYNLQIKNDYKRTEKLKSDNKVLKEKVSTQNKEYAGLRNLNPDTLKITPELTEIIIRRDSLKRERLRHKYTSYALKDCRESIFENHTESIQHKDAENKIYELDIMISEKNIEIMDILTKDLLKEANEPSKYNNNTR